MAVRRKSIDVHSHTAFLNLKEISYKSMVKEMNSNNLEKQAVDFTALMDEQHIDVDLDAALKADFTLPIDIKLEEINSANKIMRRDNEQPVK